VRRGDEDLGQLAVLSEIGKSLAGATDLRQGLLRVLEKLEQRLDVLRSAITLLNPDSREIYVEAALGFSAEGQRARYKPGEGITGRVVQSGKPIVVPRASREPLFLNRQRRQPGGPELSFVCVPILVGRKCAGALAIDLPFEKERDFEGTSSFLGVVASMIAQALEVKRLLEEERQRLSDENLQLKRKLKQRYDFSNIVGTSRAMEQAYQQIEQVAETNTTVLIRGESGTGKELIAHALHYNSPRAQKPFVKVSAAALPDTLIESELFGYERGAFTGAVGTKKGRFELADGGTLFLDEIGELNLNTQVKLLRVLQERELERLGGTETIKVNVRLIAATNKDLEAAVAAKTFRKDLFYRLNVFSIFVPPLRERRPDIMLLADHFLLKYSREHKKSIKRVATPAIDMLMSYHWPGNVRELENAIERAVVVCDGQVVHAHHLPPTLQTAEASGTAAKESLGAAVAKLETDLIQDALKSAKGNAARAARLLGTTERVLGYKIRKHRIDARRFRVPTKM
jgi:Nif-specific regulatory protein